MCQAYLMENQHIGLDVTDRQNLQGYVKTLDPIDIKKHMRGMALYYQFVGKPSLAKLASNLREQEIAKTRPVFKLRQFLGVSLEEVAKLEALGIVTVEHMLVAGQTPEARMKLSTQTGISLPVILELVKLSDLSRLGAIKSVRARLYYDAGQDTPHKFTQWEPEALRQMLIEFIAPTGFDGTA
jgi:hypothetical protein